jgi:integrase
MADLIHSFSVLALTSNRSIRMGRNSIMGGIRPKGLRQIQFDFEIDGVRFRPTLPWAPTPANLEQAQKLNARIKAQIEAVTFVFSDVFPKFKGLRKLPGSVCAKSCAEVFDAFLRHEEARVARDDLAPITLKSHRQILDCVWRPALGRLPFLAVPYSMMVKVATPCDHTSPDRDKRNRRR